MHVHQGTLKGRRRQDTNRILGKQQIDFQRPNWQQKFWHEES